MNKIICPKCFSNCYSSDTISDYLKCWRCGYEIENVYKNRKSDALCQDVKQNIIEKTKQK